MTDIELKTSLENFVIDNIELETLEDLLSQFNFFEAIGAVRSEMRHSDFLAFLLDPAQSHGLGELFLKRFLQRAIAEAPDGHSHISPIDLDVWDLHDTTIWRERDNIDILMFNERLNFMIVIENKIGSLEHSGQLTRYRKHIRERYPNVNTVYLFLSVEGREPSDSHYSRTTYNMVCTVIEEILSMRETTLGPDVALLLRHYTQMLRRHLMEDSKLIELAQRIYGKHRKALDFIFEQRPDVQSDLADLLKQKISAHPGLASDHCTKSFVRFTLREWDEIKDLNGSSGWTPTGRVLLFEFRNTPDRLHLALIIGPGNEDLRAKIFDMAIKREDLYKPSSKALQVKWNQIWSKQFASKKELEGEDSEKIFDKVEKQWSNFLERELEPIKTSIADVVRG